jgi:pimeloyl-ACP methyl ester carboxylesterase
MPNAEYDRRKPVLLVHGIQWDKKWQEHIEPALAQFMRPVPITYDWFQKAGPLLVFSEPWLLVPGVALAILAFLVGKAIGIAIGLAAILLIVLAFSSVGLSFRRQAALDAYYKLAGDDLLARPHVIAHSFGTYLTGRLLNEIPGASAERVVLVGCVLPRSFNWDGLLKSQKVHAVRNDHSKRDWVVGLAGLMSAALRKELGTSGRSGFRTSSAHSIEPNLICPQCGVVPGSIHNINCSAFGHSAYFYARTHVAKYWLPFFWNIDSGEYVALLDNCQTYATACEDENDAGIAELERKAQSTSLRWTGGQTLWEHLRRQAVKHNKPADDEAVARLLNYFCRNVAYATRDNFKTAKTKELFPHNALSAAMEGM